MGNLSAIAIRNKIIEGNKAALRKLIERKKKEDSFLLFSEKGTIVEVRAKDIILK